MFKRDISTDYIQHATNWLLLSIITANLLMLVFYNTVTYRLFFHSDAAVKNLLAGEIFRTGEFFPRDWNYANGDIWVVFGHLFILPLLPFFKNGFALHAVSGIISAGLVVWSLWLLLKELECSATARLLCLALITSGISPYLTENLFGQAPYGTILYLALFQLYFVIRYLKAWQAGGAKKVRFPLLAFGVIVFLVFLSNPARALATYVLPLLAGLMFITVRGYLQKEHVSLKVNHKAIIVVVAVLVFAGLMGMGCHRLVIMKVNNVMGAANAGFVDDQNIAHNFLGMVRGCLFLMGGLPTKGLAVLSARGIYEAWHIAFALMLFVFPFYLLAKISWEESPYLLLITVFTLVGLGIVAFFYVFTTVQADALGSSRYFTVPTIMTLMILIIKLDRWVASNGACNIKLVYPLLLLSLLPVLSTGYFVLVQPVIEKGPASSGNVVSLKPAPFDRIIQILKDNKLEYGFASYWHANVITVLSKGDIRIRAVVLGALPQPYRWLSSNEWYRANVYNGPTFFLLTDEEYKSINWVVLEAYLGKPEREFTEGSWRVIVYPFNVAGRLPGWDDQLTEPLKLLMLSSTPHQVGQLARTVDGTLKSIMVRRRLNG